MRYTSQYMYNGKWCSFMGHKDLNEARETKIYLEVIYPKARVVENMIKVVR